ncbi:hypothetical protein SAMN04488112_13111 [Melghirimyces thermohalophilus]|uniref:Transmembrane protein n=1 Tax=Melghirimyces thermohalophilus TaxID=1236220 RepID=A0A1G6RTI6_9BACL|nr:hypothetical protein [Melghirimyces thermohalophilus]SDD07858.1 hypothetical protein SAMN04488112_13111 [Melghirimyces thermohalophilus]
MEHQRRVALAILIPLVALVALSGFGPAVLAAPTFDPPPAPEPPPAPTPPPAPDRPQMDPPSQPDAPSQPEAPPAPGTSSSDGSGGWLDPDSPFTSSPEYQALKHLMSDWYLNIGGFIEGPVGEALKARGDPLYDPDLSKGMSKGSIYAVASTIVRGSLGLKVDPDSWFKKVLDLWGLGDQVAGAAALYDWNKISSLVTGAGSGIEGSQSLYLLERLKLVNIKDILSARAPAPPVTGFGYFAGGVGAAFSVTETGVNLYVLSQADDFSKQQADAMLGVISGIAGLIISLALLGASISGAMIAGAVVVLVVTTVAKWLTNYKPVRVFITAPFVGLKKWWSFQLRPITDPVGIMKSVAKGYQKGVAAISKTAQASAALTRKAVQFVKAPKEGIQNLISMFKR